MGGPKRSRGRETKSDHQMEAAEGPRPGSDSNVSQGQVIRRSARVLAQSAPAPPQPKRPRAPRRFRSPKNEIIVPEHEKAMDLVVMTILELRNSQPDSIREECDNALEIIMRIWSTGNCKRFHREGEVISSLASRSQESENKAVKLESDLLYLKGNKAKELERGVVEEEQEAETPSIDSNIRNVLVADLTSEPLDSDARVGQTEYGSETGAAGREKNRKINPNISPNPNGNLLPTDDQMTGQYEGTIRSEDEHVGGDRTGSQHLPEGTTASERAQQILAIMESAKKDVSKILTIGTQEDEKNVANLLSKIQAKDGQINKLTTELQGATGRNKLLQEEANSKNVRIKELCKKIKWLENSRTVDKIRVDFERSSNLRKNKISEMRKKLKMLYDKREIRGFKDEIKRLDTENDRLNKLVIPKLASDNKRLQRDNADLRRLIREKNQFIRQQADKIEGLQKDLKILENTSSGLRAELDKSRKLADEKLRMIRKWHEQVNREADSLKNSLLELAKDFGEEQENSELHLAAKEGGEEGSSQRAD